MIFVGDLAETVALLWPEGEGGRQAGGIAKMKMKRTLPA